MNTTHTQHTSYRLARLADCSDPDQHDGIGFEPEPSPQGLAAANGGSPGAQFLRSIEDSVSERIADNDGAVPNDYHDDAAEIADGAVPIYTHELWSTFTDLGAYNEDPSDLGADGTDMTKAASACLYIIADRLAVALFEEHEETDDDA
jgi:hypothetical protein